MAAQDGAVKAMFTAAFEDDVEGVKRLLDQDNGLLEARRDDIWCNMTPLVLAADSGSLEVTRLLLDRGADVEARDADGETALYRAACWGNEEAAALLLDRGADASTHNHDGSMPLTPASGYGHLDVVRLLLHHLRGTGLDDAGTDGRTALWRACDSGHTEVARALLLAGADHTILSGVNPFEEDDDDDEMTPLEVAQKYDRESTVTLLKWWESELERGYVVHRARYHLEQYRLWQPHFAAIATCTAGMPRAPAHLRSRCTISQVPDVDIVPLVQQQTEEGSTSKRKGEQQGGEGPYEGEKDATLKYVMHDLAPELYIELMAAFH